MQEKWNNTYNLKKMMNKKLFGLMLLDWLFIDIDNGSNVGGNRGNCGNGINDDNGCNKIN